ncbi:hypothetical protein BC936DRAFT_147301, partial [Jimgerdemannia flammicorona]
MLNVTSKATSTIATFTKPLKHTKPQATFGPQRNLSRYVRGALQQFMIPLFIPLQP